jgi:hypothetical protein
MDVLRLDLCPNAIRECVADLDYSVTTAVSSYQLPRGAPGA